MGAMHEYQSEKVAGRALRYDRHSRYSGRFQTDHDDVPDSFLAVRARSGDTNAMECLIKRYRHVIIRRAKVYYLPGADMADIIQEGAIGLFNAVLSFKSGDFRPLANLCIERKIISAIKSATRKKHWLLNNYVSLHPQNEEEQSLLEQIAGCGSGIEEAGYAGNPEDLVIENAIHKYIHERVPQVLSPFEQSILKAHQAGKSYKEIADDLGCRVKSVDNALSRARKKLPQLEQELV